MPVRRAIVAIVMLIGVIAAGCTSSAATSSPSSASAGAAGGTTIRTATSATLGTILVGSNGMTLYTHAGDSPTSSTCTGQCATAWPPLTSSGQPTAAAGLTGQLGTLTRADGTTQVTYNGLPLYYWQGDTKAGDVTGDGVNGFSVAKGSGTAPAPSPSSSGKPGY